MIDMKNIIYGIYNLSKLFYTTLHILIQIQDV